MLGSLNFTDFSLRGARVTEVLSVFRGFDSVALIFEEVPLWLVALPPTICNELCFPQLNNAEAFRNQSHTARNIFAAFLPYWKSVKITFACGSLPTPSLVLVSGSASFLNSLDVDDLNAPLMILIEGKSSSKKIILQVSWEKYRHYANGGCTTQLVEVGFKDLLPPSNLTAVKRTVGDFIDYLSLPTNMERNICANPALISKMSVLQRGDYKRRLLIPTHIFATGWGS